MTKEQCGCGCNHDHEEIMEDVVVEDFEGEVIETIHLTLDDDREITCEVIGIFEVNERHYIALDPGEEYENEVFLYELIQKDGDEVELDLIEDEDEFNAVAEEFKLLFIEEEDEEE